MEKCAYRLRQLHMGYKLSHTARTYNLTVNHRQRILSSTEGHPARYNDKTLILFDRFMNKIRRGEYNKNFEFELYDKGPNGEVITIKYCGCYVIVDNGYLKWSTTVPPMKNTNSRREIRFSDWIESMRKDVECTFGIMKGRWKVLQYGIKLHGIHKCDDLWLTCCALHNMLLEVDGLAAGWENGVQCYYEKELDSRQDLPKALKRLAKPGYKRNYDLSDVGIGNDVVKTRVVDVQVNEYNIQNKVDNPNDALT